MMVDSAEVCQDVGSQILWPCGSSIHRGCAGIANGA